MKNTLIHSQLYSLIQSKKWDEALQQVASAPHEATIWVYRKERDGKIRWRLLPLHAAIIFKAPEKVVESLLLSNPLGAQSKDDQGMLPLHLAFRNKCSEVIVTLLLMAYPKSVEVGDRKSRLPLTLAQLAPEGGLRNSYISALQKAPGYYKIAKSAIDSAAIPPNVVPAQKVEAERSNLMGKIKALETELARTKEHGTVVVNHVNQLEAQLNTRVDTERFLATKIASLDTKVKEITQSKEIREAELMACNQKLDKEKVASEDKAKTLTDEIAQLRETVGEQEEIANNRTDIKDRWTAKVKVLEEERAHAIAQAAVIEAQLKMKCKNEQFLATQVSDLAAKIADGAEHTCSSTKNYTHRIDKLEVEKTTLERSLNETNSKLKEMIETLDQITAEQLKIVECAAKHDEIVMGTVMQQEQIMVDAARQEESMEEAAKEREQIVEILTRQAMEIDRTREDREKLVQACKDQEKSVLMVRDERKMLIESVAAQRNGMDELRSKVSEVYKCNTGVDCDALDRYNNAELHLTERNNENCFRTEGGAEEKEETNEVTVIETVLVENIQISKGALNNLAINEESREMYNKLNSSNVAVTSIGINAIDSDDDDGYDYDNVNMDQQELAIDRVVKDALERIKNKSVKESSPNQQTKTTITAAAGVGNTIPTCITVEHQDDAASVASSRLSRDLFYAKETKINEAIQQHKMGKSIRSRKGLNLNLPMANSKDGNGNMISLSMPDSISMNQNHHNISNLPDPPSMLSTNKNQDNFGTQELLCVPSTIHMNQSDQALTSNKLSVPASVHVNQNNSINIADSLLGMQSKSGAITNIMHMNGYNQGIASNQSLSITNSVHISENHQYNRVESTVGIRSQSNEDDKKSAYHSNIGNDADVQSVQQLLNEAHRLVKLTDDDGNLEDALDSRNPSDKEGDI